MRTWCFLASLLTGCLRPELQECGALLCDSEQVCVADQRCVAPSQVAACVALDEGASCDSSGGPGRCIATVCEPARCGDGYIDPLDNEDCDGTAVSDTQCVALGFDLGRPACTDRCRFDVTKGCIQIGWALISNADTTAVYAKGDTLAFTRRAPSAGFEIHGPGRDVERDGAYTMISGGAGRIFVAGTERLVEVVNTDVVAIAPPPGSTIVAIASAGDGVLHVLIDCNVYRMEAGGWSSPLAVPGSGTCTKLLVGPVDDGRRVFVARSTGDVYELTAPGSRLVFTVTPPPFALAYQRGGILWFTGDGLNRYTDATGVEQLPAAPGAFPPIGDSYAVGVVGDRAYFRLDSMMVRVTPRRTYAMDLPGTGQLWVDEDGVMYMYGGPLFRFSGYALGRLTHPTSPDLAFNDIDRSSDGVVAATQRYVRSVMTGPFSVWDASNLADERAVSVSVLGPAYVNANTVSLPPNTQRIPVPGAQFLRDIWFSDDGTVAVVGTAVAGDLFAVRDAQGAWATAAAAAGCVVRGVHGLTRADIYAAGACGTQGVVWHHDGTAWTEIYRAAGENTQMLGVRAVDRDLVFAFGDRGAAQFDGSAWSFEPDVRGRSLSGTRSDAWLSGDSATVQHWDGARWSYVRSIVGNEIFVSAGDGQAIFLGATEGRVELLY